MTASQIVAAVAWVSVLAAPWAAWLRGTNVREPGFVLVVATAVLVGVIAGAHHHGQRVLDRQGRAADVAQWRMLLEELSALRDRIDEQERTGKE